MHLLRVNCFQEDCLFFRFQQTLTYVIQMLRLHLSIYFSVLFASYKGIKFKDHEKANDYIIRDRIGIRRIRTAVWPWWRVLLCEAPCSDFVRVLFPFLSILRLRLSFLSLLILWLQSKANQDGPEDTGYKKWLQWQDMVCKARQKRKPERKEKNSTRIETWTWRGHHPGQKGLLQTQRKAWQLKNILLQPFYMISIHQ